MKMSAWSTISIVALWGVFNTILPAIADELHLSNGDVITGHVIRMENYKLLFKTSYAGEIEINWPEVKNLITDDPITVIFYDGKIVSGISQKASLNMMQLETEKREAPSGFKLSEVAAINPGKKPVVKITARLNVGLTQERGNTDKDRFRLDGEFVARTEKNRYTLLGEFNKEKAKGDTTVENWLAFGRYSYFLTQKWFLYAQGLFEHDQFADLDLRSTVGTGPGEALNLSVSAGPAWVDEDFDEAEDEDYAAGQWLFSYDQFFSTRVSNCFTDR
jgi:hypothetical protein